MAAKKEPTERKRRGKAVKTERGEAATFAAGDGAGPKKFDAAKVAEDLHLWWEDGDGQTFIIGSNPKLVNGRDGELFSNVPQTWSRWPERKIVNLLRTRWVRLKPREGEVLSEADQVLLHTMQERRLGFSLSALAGYPAGIYDFDGERALVRTSPRFVEPKKGEWETIAALLEGKLNLAGDGGPDQTPFFHGWMKTAIETLYLGGPGNFRPGQCLVFAGPKNCGKSFIQQYLISKLLGGRTAADPGPYLFGRTDFNGEMFGAEHLMMSDPASGTKNVDRIYFGEMLKQLVVNDTQRLHRKREDAISVAPFFRTTISVNNDPDKMRVLPLLTPDMKDKLMLFLVAPAPMPMPTRTLDERASFRKAIEDELPAYAWWLLNDHKIADAMVFERFGVREWHHPTLALELFDDTPAAELLQIIDAAEFRAEEGKGQMYRLWDLTSKAEGEDEWDGTAIELEKLLLGEGGWFSSVVREAKDLSRHNKIDRLLGRLSEDQPTRVARHRTSMRRGWLVMKPGEAR